MALLPAVCVERRRNPLEEVARVRALHDVARRLSRRPTEPAPAHLDRRQARGVAREDAHDVWLVEALRQHRHVRDHLHRAVRERRHLHVLVALAGHHLAADSALREPRLERHAFGDGGEVHQALPPALHVCEVEVCHFVHRVVRHEVRAERAEVPFPDQAGDGARAQVPASTSRASSRRGSRSSASPRGAPRPAPPGRPPAASARRGRSAVCRPGRGRGSPPSSAAGEGGAAPPSRP